MSLAYKIEELNPDVQTVIREHNIDTGPNDAPDGQLTELDLPRIDAAIAQLERAGTDNAKRDVALLKALRPATSDGLAVPRADAASKRITDALAKSIPGEAVEALSMDDLRAAKLGERVSMIQAIINHPGYLWGTGWWQGRVNNAREQRILAILTSTPTHQRGAMIAHLYESPALLADMEGAIDGAESTQFHAWIDQHIHLIPSPTAAANILAQVSIHNEAELVTKARILREKRGDAFADAVLTQLVGMGAMQRMMPYIWWSTPTPDCTSGDAVATQIAYQGMIEAQRQIHSGQMEALLSNFPPGNAANMIRSQFDHAHNAARLVSAANIGVCVTQYLQARAERANRAAEEARRRERDLEDELRRERNRPRGNPMPGTGNSWPGSEDPPVRHAPPVEHHDDPPAAPRRTPPKLDGGGSGRANEGITIDRPAARQQPAERPAERATRTPPKLDGGGSGRASSGIQTGSRQTSDKKK